MADVERSEDIYGAKVDRCLYNSMIKFVSGMGMGIVASALFFKRKPWPLLVGGGIGVGMGIASCNYELKYAVPINSLGQPGAPQLLGGQGQAGAELTASRGGSSDGDKPCTKCIPISYRKNEACPCKDHTKC